jgi:hypothetical protein
MARHLTHPSALATHSEHLTTRSNELSIALNSAISDHKPITDAVHNLQALVPEVIRLRGLVDGRDLQKGVIGRFGYAQDVEEDEEVLKARLGVVGRVGEVFGTSERVGGKVRRLDGRLGRVREAVARVGEVMEFKVRRVKREKGVPSGARTKCLPSAARIKCLPSEARERCPERSENKVSPERSENQVRAEREQSVSRAQRESSPSTARIRSGANIPSKARIKSEQSETKSCRALRESVREEREEVSTERREKKCFSNKTRIRSGASLPSAARIKSERRETKSCRA